MCESIYHIIEWLTYHPELAVASGIVVLLFELIIISVLYGIIEGVIHFFWYTIRLVKRYFEHVRAVIVYFITHKEIFWMLIRMIAGLVIIVSISCLTFHFKTETKQNDYYVGWWAITLISVGIAYYVIYAIYRLFRLNKELREQYHEIMKFYNFLDYDNGRQKTSYLQYILGIISDKENVICWFTNIIFYMCAPIALLTYTYSLFCCLDDIVYIVSLVSIVMAFYSVWQSISADREATKKLNKILKVNGYKEEKPNNSNREDWLDI